MYLMKYQWFTHFRSNCINLPKCIKSVLTELMHLSRFDCIATTSLCSLTAKLCYFCQSYFSIITSSGTCSLGPYMCFCQLPPKRRPKAVDLDPGNQPQFSQGVERKEQVVVPLPQNIMPDLSLVAVKSTQPKIAGASNYIIG